MSKFKNPYQLLKVTSRQPRRDSGQKFRGSAAIRISAALQNNPMNRSMFTKPATRIGLTVSAAQTIS
jgi:hypothetical protein